ncbi:MAG: glycosyltransferase [Candidatus Aenigmatarchaeota archaeon]
MRETSPAKDYYLAPGRLDPIKRVDLIIEAFKQLKDKNLIIIGDGPEKSKLLSMAKGYANIKILDVSTQEELRDYYSKCICCIAIPNDDYTMVPLEAAAAGKPSIVSDDFGVRETVVENKTGILIKPDVKNLVNAINSMTPEVAESMKKDCLNFAKKFDIDIFYEKWENKIKSMLD